MEDEIRRLAPVCYQQLGRRIWDDDRRRGLCGHPCHEKVRLATCLFDTALWLQARCPLGSTAIGIAEIRALELERAGGFADIHVMEKVRLATWLFETALWLQPHGPVRPYSTNL